MTDDWELPPEHDAQYLRIVRSGLKPEPGAWERSWRNMFMREAERNQAAIKERKRVISAANCWLTAVAVIGRPKQRKKADEFRADPRNPWVEVEPSDFQRGWDAL